MVATLKIWVCSLIYIFKYQVYHIEVVQTCDWCVGYMTSFMITQHSSALLPLLSVYHSRGKNVCVLGVSHSELLGSSSVITMLFMTFKPRFHNAFMFSFFFCNFNDLVIMQFDFVCVDLQVFLLFFYSDYLNR